MSIFLTGATGFIGYHLLQTLHQQGHHVTCLVRHASQHTNQQRLRQLLVLPNVTLVEGEWTNPTTWLDAMAGHTVVINTVGIIRESQKASFEQVHTIAPLALFDAAKQTSVRKVIQISAMGANEAAQSRFHRSKRDADLYLTQLGLPYVILRPSFVYGPGDHSISFFSLLAGLPLTPVPGDGHYRVQPLYVNDLVQAVLLAIKRTDLEAVTIDIGGGQVLTFNAMLDIIAQQDGKPHGARKLHIPWKVVGLIARFTDLLGGHGPINGEELAMLRRENFTDNKPLIELFGFEPLSFKEGIKYRNSSAHLVQHGEL